MLTEKQKIWQREYRKKRKLDPLYRININKKDTEWRHKTGRSKKYLSERKLMKTIEHVRMRAKCSKAISKYEGKLSIKTLQLVYENNIKKYGTLTCYLCLKPIEFKQDSLDHKISAINGGTNDYDNLAVAHLRCNLVKNKRSEEYFINYMNELTKEQGGRNGQED